MTKKFYHPVRDRILVRRIEESEQTEGGLYKVAEVEDLVRGESLAVGGGSPYMRPSASEAVPAIPITHGDIVFYPPKVGVDIRIDGELLRVLQYDQVFVVESNTTTWKLGYPYAVSE